MMETLLALRARRFMAPRALRAFIAFMALRAFMAFFMLRFIAILREVCF
jgi:hypothetical protein